MDAINNISDLQQQHLRSRRAMSIANFCELYEVSRTTAYSEIKAGRLRARKCGKRTIITEDDAEDWLKRLPIIGAVR